MPGRGLPRDQAISAFEDFLNGSHGLLARLPELSGNILVCHCARHLACHCDVLIDRFRKEQLKERPEPDIPSDEKIRDVARARRAAGSGPKMASLPLLRASPWGAEGPALVAGSGHALRLLADGGVSARRASA